MQCIMNTYPCFLYLKEVAQRKCIKNPTNYTTKINEKDTEVPESEIELPTDVVMPLFSVFSAFIDDYIKGMRPNPYSLFNQVCRK